VTCTIAKVASRCPSKLGGASAGTMKVSVPPRFGSSASAAAAQPSASVRAAAVKIERKTTCVSPAGSRRPGCLLFIEPHRGEILVQVMARADLPAFDIRPVRDDAVPPRQHDLVRLGVEHVFLELAHRRPLLCRIGLV